MSKSGFVVFYQKGKIVLSELNIIEIFWNHRFIILNSNSLYKPC